MQCVVDNSVDVRSEYVVRITGVVRERPEGTVNANLPTGEVELGECVVEVLRTADGRLVVAIADVMGKGVPAALFMAMSMTLLRSLAKQHADPAEILRRLNDELVEYNPRSVFVTMACFVVDLAAGITGDFNNDGKADVMWRNVTGAVSLWTMDGATITSNVAMPTIDNTWRFQSLGDFNGDHKSDVLWRHVSGQIVFWQMDGATIKDNQPLQAQVDLSWHVMGTGDFNGDGKTDVVWRHNSGFVSLWTMDGYNIAANNAVADITNNWQIRAIGDYNGDGKSDLLWQDTGSGFVALWQMNGPSIAANVAVTTIGSDWSVAFSQGSSLDFV